MDQPDIDKEEQLLIRAVVRYYEFMQRANNSEPGTARIMNKCELPEFTILFKDPIVAALDHPELVDHAYLLSLAENKIN
jgi:hypothetical protein